MNGLVTLSRISKFDKTLRTIIKLKKKYGNNEEIIFVSSRISLEFSKYLSVVKVLVNGNSYIKYTYGVIGTGKSLVTGLTLGVLDSPITFDTLDQSIRTKEFAQSVYEELSRNTQKIEEYFKSVSQERWK